MEQHRRLKCVPVREWVCASVMRCSLASGTVLNGSVSACILEIPCTYGCGPCSAQVLVIWQIYRKFVLSISLSLSVFPVVFSFVSSFFPLTLYFYFSLCLSHMVSPTFLFFHSLLYSFSFSSLWRFLSSSLLVIILGLEIFLFLSCTLYP